MSVKMLRNSLLLVVCFVLIGESLCAMDLGAGHFSYLSSGHLYKNDTVQNLQLKTVAGEKHELLEKNGQTKLIAIMSPGCGYSIASIKLLKQVDSLSLLNGKSLDLVTIWVNEPHNVVERNHEDLIRNISWLNLVDKERACGVNFRMDTYPRFYVVGSDGLILSSFSGLNKRTAKKMRKLLEETRNEPTRE